MGLKGPRYATSEGITSNATVNSAGFEKRPSAGVSNNGRIDEASVCARKVYFRTQHTQARLEARDIAGQAARYLTLVLKLRALSMTWHLAGY
jgi:hypothetical protein